jgi:predicted metal-dependent TIM-barrel fold hydrolase
MRFIDAHLHSDMIEDIQLQKLVMMGMEAAIVPSPHMFLGNPPLDTLFRIWDRFVTLEVTTAQTLGYESYASLSVPFIGLGESDTAKALSVLPGLLEHERVVAMGEIGLDTGTDYEVDLFREHLRIAKAHDLPVILHTPIRLAPQGAKVTPRILEIIREEGFPEEKCVFDHAGEATLDFRMSTGGMVGLSVCWDKMPPEVAARYVIDNPEKRGRIIINSELGGEGNDYFMVPRVMLAMKLFGLDTAAIEEVCYQNPKAFFKLDVDGGGV